MDTKICLDCRLEKLLIDFNFCQRDGYGVRCKICKNIKNSNWRKNNPESAKESSKKWAEKNPEKVRAKVDKYQDKNREKIIKQKRFKRYGRDFCIKLKHDPNSDFQVCAKCRQEKPKDEYNGLYYRCFDCRKEDYQEKCKNPGFKKKERARFRQLQKKKRSSPQGRISARMSNAIWHALKENKSFKSWESLVGYSSEDLKQHLEKMFTDGMTWEIFMNGEIHIDHVVPESWFKYETAKDEQFKQCWCLENLQPLWKEDNLRKNNRYIG